MTENTIFKSGYITIAGKPNVGKSTLLNNIMGQKISIVTPKPQTTRDSILAIYNTDNYQMVFLDTPGLHRPQKRLGHYMNEVANGAISQADICLWLLDAADRKRIAGLTDSEKKIAHNIKDKNIKTIAILNKTDLVRPKDKLLPILSGLGELDFIEAIIPISALSGDGVSLVLDEIQKYLPTGQAFYPKDMLSDRADRYFVAELVREAIMNITEKEVPYQTAVVIDKYTQHTSGCEIFASIHVETSGQKKIIIGKQGQKIGEIRQQAQTQAEALLNCPVKLRLHVDISPDWSTNPAGLKKMGYE